VNRNRDAWLALLAVLALGRCAAKVGDMLADRMEAEARHGLS
jgi:hypothetical protein